MKDPLTVIPGIGKSLAEDLRNIGITEVADLKGKDPEEMYKKLEEFEGVHQDRCVLYTFRCAVYFAETKKPKKELLRWWDWKDRQW